MMKILPEQLVQEWEGLLSRTPVLVRHRIQQIAEQHQHALASGFYEHMLNDQVASRLLNHEQVQTRLHASMMRWVAEVFGAQEPQALMAAVVRQGQVGVVHARIDVPMHLVLRGARCLKQHLHDLVCADAALGVREQREAVHFVGSTIDLAMEAMSQAYHASNVRSERASEAYRLHEVVQNLGAERERQRAALLDWENQFMFDQAMGLTPQQLPRIQSSGFGQWFRHKAAHVFLGTTEVQQILQGMVHIDDVLLPQFVPAAQPDERMQHMRRLREQTRSLVFLLDTLFESNSELDAGRDVLTRLLNRKFLPVVMTREVKYARDHKSEFAVLVIDVDHFKRINDEHGHEAGDLVLQQLAAILLNCSRGGDYAFRLGGEEFLMVLVDVTQAQAIALAERVRRQVQSEAFRLPNAVTLHLTVSVGVAMHDGHPDYQLLLRRGDEATYAAKSGGRNRVVLAAD